MVQLQKDIDKEFEEFVKNNYGLLTKNQKEICRKLGIVDNQEHSDALV